MCSIAQLSVQNTTTIFFQLQSVYEVVEGYPVSIAVTLSESSDTIITVQITTKDGSAKGKAILY